MTMTDPSLTDNALAAAVAAAADIARTPGGLYFLETALQSLSNSPENAEMVLLNLRSKEHKASLFQEHDNDSAKPVKSVSFESSSESTIQTETSEGLEPNKDANNRLARSRERNREHARRTRMRKKAHLEALQAKVQELEEERRILKQNVEECSIASILVGLASGGQTADTDSLLEGSLEATQTAAAASSKKVIQAFTGKRKRFLSEEPSTPKPIQLEIGGRMMLIDSSSHINWKSGAYRDENGEQRQLTQEQLKSLRRERNRMHAKMTRDRKKCFISTMERTIQQLEAENQQMKDALLKVASPTSTPTLTPRLSPEPCSQEDESASGSASEMQPPSWSLKDA